jgi:acyl-CoA thioester hydrolase|tara:strand:- start:747 stop:1193 length:447 start_codon:yes stop_codon:yes gene_type:complete
MPMPEHESEIGGRFEAGGHVLALRVYWEDTDAAGIVYYANYLKFIERGRSDLLRLLGIDQAALYRESGVAFAVRRCEIDYLKPARLDDRLEVRSRLVEVRGASVRAEQVVWRAGTELMRAQVRLGCIDPTGRARRLPPPVRAALAATL